MGGTRKKIQAAKHARALRVAQLDTAASEKLVTQAGKAEGHAQSSTEAYELLASAAAEASAKKKRRWQGQGQQLARKPDPSQLPSADLFAISLRTSAPLDESPQLAAKRARLDEASLEAASAPAGPVRDAAASEAASKAEKHEQENAMADPSGDAMSPLLQSSMGLAAHCSEPSGREVSAKDRFKHLQSLDLQAILIDNDKKARC